MIFFGTSTFSIYALDKLSELGIIPSAIVTVPDRPAGRKLVLTPPPVKVWAIEKNIPYFQFEKLNTPETIETLKKLNSDIFIVASYGKIIPQHILDIPTHGALNIHPSLLPKLRGATPLQSSIMLDMQDTGVTIIQMDKEMDHGPIVAQHRELITPWPQSYLQLEKYLAEKGAEILAQTLPDYMSISNKTSNVPSASSKSILQEQDHSEATFTKKIEKGDGLISLDRLSGPAGWKNFLKYNALMEWPGLYFFAQKDGVDIRVKVKEASWNTMLDTMEILRVIPEGKKEMAWKDFENYLKSTSHSI